MTTEPNSAAQQAREALGVRLREIRRGASLTGRALAAALDCHCGADDQLADLIASVRAIDSMYLEWRRQTRAGMKRLMLSSVPLYQRTRLFRIYEHNIVPGLFQTADYSAAMLRYFIDLLETPNDLDAAIAARMERQRVLYTGDRRFVVVLEERAVRIRVGDPDVMAGQLDRLLAVMSLPRVSLGIIPETAVRTVFASAGFWMYDNGLVAVETPSASLEITQPREIRLYDRMFAQLQEAAVYGAQARTILHATLDGLGGGVGGSLWLTTPAGGSNAYRDPEQAPWGACRSICRSTRKPTSCSGVTRWRCSLG